jgi:8-oxo-dGTP pyrophosphatase MutT (NUDIX family)
MSLPKDPEKRNYMFSDDMKISQKAVVFHPQNPKLFLALKRWPGDKSRANKWDLPGGNLNFGQETEPGLRREIREETSLEVRDIKPTKVWSRYFRDTKVYHLFIGYTCTAKNDKVALSHEHTEFLWMTKHEFLQLKSADFLMEMVEAIDN